MRIEGDHRIIPPVGNIDEADRQEDLTEEGRARHQDQDVVEISDSAKHLHTQATCPDSSARADTDFSRRMIAIRERIRSGFYSSEEVLDQIAGRIIDLGDL